jgi:chemotaxis protein methyltransferase CheR
VSMECLANSAAQSPTEFGSPIVTMEDREFALFRTLVQKHTGIWLRDGKQIMLASRLSRRLRLHSLNSFAEYYDFLQSSHGGDDELREMINCVTTNKTSFFRENHHFEHLRSAIVPEHLKSAGEETQRIRIWSAACSTGEEPYSIAITLFDALEVERSKRTLNRTRQPLPMYAANRAIEIVASDIDTTVLEKAKRGIYAAESLADVDEQTRKRHFMRGKDEMSGYVKVKPHIMSSVTFKRINLMDKNWPLEGLFDVIFFRNALIYFKQETQDLFLRKMARYLRPNGYLFLGSSEHIPWLSNLYRPLNRTMYQLKDVR